MVSGKQPKKKEERIRSAPDYCRDRSSKAHRLKVLIICAAAFLVFGILANFFLYLVFRTDFLAVKSVEIIGVEQQNLKDSILNSFRAKNLNVLQRMAGINSVFSWTDGSGDLRLMPQIKKAEVEVKSYQRKVVIEAKEREKEGVWCPNSPDGGECYWFDSEGVLFLRSSRPEGGLVRLVVGYHGQKPNFLTSFYPDGWSGPVRSVFGILEMSGMPSRTVYLTPPDREEIYVDLKGGPRLLFSTKFDPAHALPVLETLRMENKLNSLQYVDFRTENRAYYK